MKQKSAFDKIYEVVKQIPPGNVATYGQIAELAGNRRWARVVGYALHANPDPANIPCHRVVTKLGQPSRAFVFGGVNQQITLLKKEGIAFTEKGTIDMRKYQWGKKIL